MSDITGANCGYYYHPLGNLGEDIISYTTETTPLGALKWDTNSSSPVYAMTNGIIYKVKTNKTEGSKGFKIFLKTDRIDASGKEIYICYAQLGGLSDQLCNLLGIPTGSLTEEDFLKTSVNYSGSIAVSMMDEIGYTNNWADTSSDASMLISFLYKDNDISDEENITELPHVGNEISSAFNLTKLSDGNYKVEVNGELIGTEVGKVKLKNNNSSSYNVYPYLSYLVGHQKASYVVGGMSGGIPMLDKTQIARYKDMNQDAVDFYLTGSMSDNWTGAYPNSIEEVNNNSGLRYATRVCLSELNFDEFSGPAYAKLIRAKMIGENRSGNNMKEWFENLNDSQFDVKSGWRTKKVPSDKLAYAQTVYMNLKYPNLYGSEYFNGTDEFYNSIIYGCQQIPIYNLHPITYKPLAFCVNFNVKTNKDEGENGGGGNFLMYRQQSADLKYFNQKIKG